jgi:hypothetical protein
LFRERGGVKINPYEKLIVLIVYLIILYVSKTAIIVSLIGVGIGVLISPIFGLSSNDALKSNGVSASFSC